jgi:hypothetical protein
MEPVEEPIGRPTPQSKSCVPLLFCPFVCFYPDSGGNMSIEHRLVKRKLDFVGPKVPPGLTVGAMPPKGMRRPISAPSTLLADTKSFPLVRVLLKDDAGTLLRPDAAIETRVGSIPLLWFQRRPPHNWNALPFLCRSCQRYFARVVNL